MSWEEPEFEPINMSAEIGAYHDDFSGEAPAPRDAPPPGVALPITADAESGAGQDP